MGAFLSDVPSNLTIVTDVTAEKILFDQGKVVGVTTNKGIHRKMNAIYDECLRCR